MAEPLRVGVLSDTVAAAGVKPGESVERCLRLAVDPLVASGRIDRDVEYVHAHGLGLPTGTAAAVERGLEYLADQDVLVVIGPAIGDNALVATPVSERLRVPTINWAGTERARGEWMFHLQVGSHEDEALVIARFLSGLGVRRVGVLYDRSPIGRRYLAFFQGECEVLDLAVASAASVAPMTDDVRPEIDALERSSVEAVVYLGLGLAAPAVASAVLSRGLDVPKMMNTAGLRGYAADFARRIDGWNYVDMVSDDNRVLQGLLARAGADDAFRGGLAYGYDLGQLLAEGLARASELTRHGVREGLESVKWIPAAEGHDGTHLSFGHFDHGALHGRYLVARQWRSGESVQVS